MDTDGGVEAEAADGLPGEHVLDGVLVEDSAALQRALEASSAVRWVAWWKVTLPSSPPEKTPSRMTT
jgi:hypothetical protein